MTAIVKKWPVTLRLLLVFLCLVPLISQSEEVILASEDSWPPYSNAQGEGISKQKILEALSGSPFEVKFVVVPYSRALWMTEEGKVHGSFNVARQQDTEEKFDFGQEPLLTVQASQFYPVGAQHVYSSIADVPDGMKVGLIIDYEYGDEYEQQRARFDEFRVKSQKQIIRMLTSGRIDMAIMYDEVAKYTLDAMSLGEGAIQKGSANHISQIYVAFSKKKENARAIMEALDNGLRRIKAKEQ